MKEDNKVENKPDEQEVPNESGAIEAPVNKFACLGIAECQQVLERLIGGNIMDSLPYAVQTLMDEFKHDKDTLKREVSERKEVLQRHRQKAIDFQILKKYAPALEAYDAYFEVLGSQIGDYEAEKLRKECRQYVEQAKKRRWQMIAAAVVALILCGVIVDQVFYRKNVNAFQEALHLRDLEGATEAAIKISWRGDTEEGISNLICFLDEKDRFNQLFSDELIKTALDNYGGIEWQEVLKLVEQANANEDLPQGIQQVCQASKTTPGLINNCVVLEKNERDFNAMYESCNQKDADYYVSEKWADLQQLCETEVTQTNLNVISERYNLMVEITNQVSRLMGAQKDMLPVKDAFEEKLKEEQIQVQGMLNYTSIQLDEAQRMAGIALKKEEALEFVDARLIYIRAIEHIKASKENRQEDEDKLAKIEQVRREFNDLYEKLDIGTAQAKCPDEWKALSDQKKKAESEYAKEERWNGDAYVDYEAALRKLKKLGENMKWVDKMYESKEAFDLLYGKVHAGRANDWFPGEWNVLRDQRKKADAAYHGEDPDKDDVRVYYDEASQKALNLLVKVSDKARKEYNDLCKGMGEQVIGVLEKEYPDDWKKLQVLLEKTEMKYEEITYWDGGAYNLLIGKLTDIYYTGKKDGKFDILDLGDSSRLEKLLRIMEDSKSTPTNGIPNL